MSSNPVCCFGFINTHFRIEHAIMNNKAERFKSRARNSISHCVVRSVRPSVSPLVPIYCFGGFKQFKGRKVTPTDGLTNTLTYRAACTRLMAIGLVFFAPCITNLEPWIDGDLFHGSLSFLFVQIATFWVTVDVVLVWGGNESGWSDFMVGRHLVKHAMVVMVMI